MLGIGVVRTEETNSVPKSINQKNIENFTSNLTLLDAMMRSIKVR